MERAKAFELLDGERRYQERLHKKTGQEIISVPGELALLKVYLNRAFEAYTETFGDPGEQPTMDIVRKMGGICLRAIENHGCPPRDIEASLAKRPPEHIAGTKEAMEAEERRLGVDRPGDDDFGVDEDLRSKANR